MAQVPSPTLAPLPTPHLINVPIPLRAPAYPLKTERGLTTDAEIAQARDNVVRYPAAKKVADGIIKAAEVWLDWSDADLALLATPPSIPRAFDVSSGAGCPRCGKEIYKFGTYPWIVDLKKPFKLTCPIDGTVYPCNDYETYYKSGFKEKRGWDTQYVDDGWGWSSPSGEKLWWVAFYNHEVWHKFLGPGISNLGRAYLLTGDTRYAHKAAVLLYHIAAVYPGMDHETQSRYGSMQRARGLHYPGKVMNAIWETSLAKSFAEAYDDVWVTLDGDTELQKLVGKDGAGLRSFIEANLLEDSINAYFQGKIRGNFGMHQSALAMLMLTRQYGERQKWLDDLMNHNGAPIGATGINLALYNLISRDGVPFETAPGYNFLWVNNLNVMAEPLRKMNVDLFKSPRMERFYEAPLDLINIGKFTPDLGDSGAVYGGLVGKSPDVYQTAYRVYKNERFASFLASMGATGDKGFQSYESLFSPPITSSATAPLPQRARLLDGYGMGILSNPTDTVSTSLYFGYKGGHGHADRLGLELFAAGQPMIPDLGYPDAANDYVASRYAWSTNTIAHNTVTVDASKQPGNVEGTTHLFADGPFARVLDVDGNGTYPQCSVYRRNLLMVDAGEGRSYYVDIFDVTGGKQHDYSLHGPPGTFEMLGDGKWSDKAPGTLAGENVPVGQIYDDEKLQKQGEKIGYSSYAGSGFQYLLNVQRLQGEGGWVAQWTHEKTPDAKLRIRVLPQSGQELILADASVSPLKSPQLIKFIIARHEAGGSGNNLSSRFVSVIEPFEKEAFIAGARQIPLDSGLGTTVEVKRNDGQTDLVIHDATSAVKKLKALGLATNAQSAVVTLDSKGEVVRVFFAGGTYLTVKGHRYAAPNLPSGTVASVFPTRATVRVRLARPKAAFNIADLVGRTVYFQNDLHRVAHPIASAKREDDELVLTTRDDMLVGRVKLTGVEKDALETDTQLAFGATYGGDIVTNLDGKSPFRLSAIDGGSIKLVGPLPAKMPFKVGEELWLSTVGPGDHLDVPTIYSWMRQGKQITEDEILP